MRVLLLFIAAFALARPGFAQWSGSMQCTLSASAADYQEEQTHTWQIVPGDPLPYDQWPAVWTVQGKGARRTTSNSGSVVADSWTIAAPPKSAPIRFAQRPAGGPMEIRSTHGMLVAQGAISIVSSSGQRSIESLQEWLFPVVEGPMADPVIRGTRTRKLEQGNGWRKPTTVWTTETCTWNFARASAVEVSSIAPAMPERAIALPTAAGAVLAPAPVGPPLQAGGGASGRGAAEPRQTSGPTPQPTPPSSELQTADTGASRSGAIATGLTGGLTEVVEGRTVLQVTPVLTGPTRLSLRTGAQATFRLVVLMPQGSHPLTKGAVTMQSGEGETASVQLGGPSSSRATATEPASFSATFVFEKPGTYVVSSAGTVGSEYTVPTYSTVTVPVYGYDAQCGCQKQVGTSTHQVMRYESRVESWSVSQQLQVMVIN